MLYPNLWAKKRSVTVPEVTFVRQGLCQSLELSGGRVSLFCGMIHATHGTCFQSSQRIFLCKNKQRMHS
jgi:hypothetical protein